MRCCCLYIVSSTDSQVTVQADGSFGTNEMVLPMNEHDFKHAVELWDSGVLVQDVFPKFNAVQREFLITGMSEKQQKKVYG